MVSSTTNSGQVDAQEAKQRYEEERQKRLRDEGNKQFIDISLTKSYLNFQDDPWVDEAKVQDLHAMFPKNRCKILVLGAGIGGVQYATYLLDSTGTSPEEVRIVDSAGGFGGAWYWNRYPGLTCDFESYSYLPRLEEMDYMPKHRYAHSEEIRAYTEKLATKWNLTDSAVFQSKAEKLQWDETAKEWGVELIQQRKDKSEQKLTIRSQVVVMANGVLNYPKLPGLPGILDYRGSLFHTSRWNYSVTGGSPADPSLTNLRDKRVAIIGTGSTGVGAVPILARYAKHLYVIQRTPGSVDKLEQRKTDPEWFYSKVATGPGWQRERLKHVHGHLTTGEKPKDNLVQDHWSEAIGMVAVAGDPAGPQSMEELGGYLEKLNAIDLVRQNRLRTQVSEVVKDQSVAKSLQAWYPTWCKRPAFSSDYHATFNRENVTLVDTQGKGPEKLTADSIVAGGQEYPVDIVICATGFRAPIVGTPANKANVEIIGRNGVSMADEWAKNGASTLHGVLDYNFPNLLLSGPWQGALSPNNSFSVGTLAKHGAQILAAALREADGKPFAVTPTNAAAEDWRSELLKHSLPSAAMMGCIPSYFNAEGELDRLPEEEQMKMAKSGLWGHGIEDFIKQLEKWWVEGGVQKGIHIDMTT